jgi:PII-like signaling protein
MRLEGEQTLLRVYLSNTDKQGWFSRPAVEALVQRAQTVGLAGATVLQGFFGLDVTGRLLEPRFWSFVDRVPVIVEVVDSPRAIGRFLADVEALVWDGLATLERGHVLLYRQNREAAARAGKHLEAPDPVPPGSAASSAEAPGPLTVPPPIIPLSTLPSPEEFPAMRLSEYGQLLRVFIGESDTWEGIPLYRAIVLKARELGLAGATVLRGPMGFGANSRIHTTKLLELSTDLPVVIEIVDVPEKIQELLPFLDETVTEGLITIEEVRILKYRHGPGRGRSPEEGPGQT